MKTFTLLHTATLLLGFLWQDAPVQDARRWFRIREVVVQRHFELVNIGRAWSNLDGRQGFRATYVTDSDQPRYLCGVLIKDSDVFPFGGWAQVGSDGRLY